MCYKVIENGQYCAKLSFTGSDNSTSEELSGTCPCIALDPNDIALLLKVLPDLGGVATVVGVAGVDERASGGSVYRLQ
jgi:hypothetical protein